MTSILIVEDDNDINNLICDTLKAEGYQCERAFDGKEGADKIEPVSYTHLSVSRTLAGHTQLVQQSQSKKDVEEQQTLQQQSERDFRHSVSLDQLLITVR